MHLKSLWVLLLSCLVLVAVAGACGDDDDDDTDAESTTAEDTSESTEAEESTDEASTPRPPLIVGFYDGNEITYLLTDVSIEAEAEGLTTATGYPVAFVASLGEVQDAATAKLYLFMNGVEGSNPFGFQPNVVDTVPGDEGYSPLWRVHAVTWTDGAEASELRSEDEILEAEEAGDLSVEVTPLVKNSPVVDSDPPLVGGFYDGETVEYLLTDVSIESEAEGLSEATGFPVSFVASIGDVPDGSTAKLYLFMNGVEGPNPFGFQANVIDSVPGDPEYSPLWRVFAVNWADGVEARELRSEEDILEAEAAGELTVERTDLVKNSPVVP